MISRYLEAADANQLSNECHVTPISFDRSHVAPLSSIQKSKQPTPYMWIGFEYVAIAASLKASASVG